MATALPLETQTLGGGRQRRGCVLRARGTRIGGVGLVDAGAVLVGTHAFAVLGNVLAVQWASRGAAHPSTSFKIRGQALRVDLLCPKRGAADDPVFIRRFGAAAQPLAYLDYLLAELERAVLIDGGAALVNVPGPARFAFHKLLVATLRPAAFQAKAEKDVVQAAQVLEVLVEARPGDLRPAWDSLRGAGRSWDRAARRGLALLGRRHSAVHARVAAMLRSS